MSGDRGSGGQQQRLLGGGEGGQRLRVLRFYCSDAQAVILANLVRERDFEVLKKSAKVDKVYINIYSDR